MVRSTILATVALGVQLTQSQYIDEQVYPSRKHLTSSNTIDMHQLIEYSQRNRRRRLARSLPPRLLRRCRTNITEKAFLVTGVTGPCVR
jgi:hypothetical protein